MPPEEPGSTPSAPAPAAAPAPDGPSPGRATPPSLLDLSTYLLSRAGKAARSRLAERLARRGLRLWDMAVLAALADFGPHAQRDLVRRLGVDASDMAKVVDRLGLAGYVERTRDAADRRRLSVTVTEAGRVLLAELRAEALAVQGEVLAPLSGTERRVLHELLARIHAELPGTP